MMALIGMADLVVLLVSLHSSSHSSSLADLLLSPPIVRASVYFLAPCVALVVGGTVLMVDREAATTRKRTSFGSASSGGRQSRSTTLDYSNNAYQSLHLILNDSGHLLDSSTLSRPSYTDDDDDEDDDDVAASDRAPLVAAPIEGTATNVAVPLVVGDDTDDHDDDDKQHAHGKATDRLAADEEEEERDNTWDDWLRVGRVLWTQRSPFAAAFLGSTISGVLQLFSNSWIGATVGIVTDAGPTSRGTLHTLPRAKAQGTGTRLSSLHATARCRGSRVRADSIDRVAGVALHRDGHCVRHP